MWEERLSEFVTLFVVVNPLGMLPVFVAATAGVAPSMQRRVALIAVLAAFGILLFFMVAGGFLLEQLGISLRSFQIAGGIVLFLIAIDMVHGVSHTPSDLDPDRSAKALALYPLAIPKIAGPATMLAVVLLTDDHRFNIPQLAMTAGVLALVLAITFVVLLAAGPISRLIGKSGANVIGRVLGMILAALAVHTILSTVANWLGLPPL